MPARQHLTTDDIGVIIGPVHTWSPTAITLGSAYLNGAIQNANAGAGTYITFDPSSDDEILFNIALPRNGLAYDGSVLKPTIDWMKFGNTGGTVLWEVDYAFISIGDDAYSKIDGTITSSVDVTAIADQTLIQTVMTGISGPVGALCLQLTIRRNSTGPGADTYSGDGEIYGFNVTL